MRISVTDRQHISQENLRPTVELAPALALPWLLRLRYGILTVEGALILIAVFVAQIRLPLPWLTVLLVVALVSNAFFRYFGERFGARRAVSGVLLFDVIGLTAVLALSGGPYNPFTVLYLVQITLSAVVLSRAWTWVLGAVSIVGFGSLFLVHIRVPMLEGHHPAQSFSVHLTGMWLAFVTAAILITALVGKVSETLRDHEQELLRLQGVLGRQERIASLATLAAGAAHEMGTPLATIAVAAKELEHYAKTRSHDSQVALDAGLIRSEVDRCARILHGMSTKGSEFMGESPQIIELEKLFEELRNDFPEPHRSMIQATATRGLTAAVPKETTRHVLSALVQNAIDASPDGQLVHLLGEAHQDRVRFTVTDSGTGMPPETLERVAEPFYTTKSPGRGMGLGTFLVRSFAENLGGTLVFDSVVGCGTTAILELPLVQHNIN